jgi:TonB family protein
MWAAGVFVATVATAHLHAQGGSVSAARELYASASYEESLKMLEGLTGEAISRPDRQAVAFYRILCLIALGRTDAAAQALDALVTQEPLYQPPTDDLSPRLRTMFVEARKRLLPVVIQQRYREAKAAYDAEQFELAAASFALLLEAVADPVIADAAAQPPLSDLRTLATGFHDLSVKAAAPPPPLALPAAAPVVVIEAPPAPPVRDYRRVYTLDDADVVPPTPVKQTLPPFAGRMLGDGTGTIDVLIDAMGDVEKATISSSIDPRYDAQLLAAAQRWQYKPATVEGVPVKFFKTVQVNLSTERR